jgi:hypothetical protein
MPPKPFYGMLATGQEADPGRSKNGTYLVPLEVELPRCRTSTTELNFTPIFINEAPLLSLPISVALIQSPSVSPRLTPLLCDIRGRGLIVGLEFVVVAARAQNEEVKNVEAAPE